MSFRLVPKSVTLNDLEWSWTAKWPLFSAAYFITCFRWRQIKTFELVSKASRHFNMDWLFGFNLKCKLSVIFANGVVWSEGEKVKRWCLSKKYLCHFTAELRSCAFLDNLTMGTPFPCVPAAFQQWERRSHAFPLEMTTAPFWPSLTSLLLCTRDFSFESHSAEACINPT